MYSMAGKVRSCLVMLLRYKVIINVHEILMFVYRISEERRNKQSRTRYYITHA